MAFQQQEPSASGFTTPLRRPQQVGVRLKPDDKVAPSPQPKKSTDERRSV